MEITGKIIQVLEPTSFVSQKNGKTYVTNIFVIDTGGQFSKKIAFKVIGEDKFAQMGIIVGNTYSISFDVESREWKGKWFTECQAWKVVNIDGTQKSNDSTESSTPNPSTSESSSNDLPF